VTAGTPPRTGPALATGLAIECATERVEVLVREPGSPRAAQAVTEVVGHGHTRRLTALVRRALE
jgi:hypothetical protein